MALVNPWTGRSAGQIDADSPIDETLITSLSDDLYFLRQVAIGDGSGGFKTANDGHDHDGTNSKKIANATIEAGKTVPRLISKVGDNQFLSTTSVYPTYSTVSDGIISVHTSDHTVRVSVRIKISNAAHQVQCRIRINGTLQTADLALGHTGDTLFAIVTTTLDITSLASGDYRIETRLATTNATATATIEGLRVALVD